MAVSYVSTVGCSPCATGVPGVWSPGTKGACFFIQKFKYSDFPEIAVATPIRAIDLFPGVIDR